MISGNFKTQRHRRGKFKANCISLYAYIALFGRYPTVKSRGGCFLLVLHIRKTMHNHTEV
jgi:hypothetical protein